MARRRYTVARYPRRRRSGGLGGISLKKVGMGILAGAVLPGVIGYGAAYVLAGVPGAIGAFISPMALNMIGGANIMGQVGGAISDLRG